MRLMTWVAIIVGFSTLALWAQPAIPARTSTTTIKSSTLVQRFKATGKTGVVQGVVSVIALAIALERAFNLRRKNVVPAELHKRAVKLIGAKDFDNLDVLCVGNPSTLSRIIALILKHPGSSMANLSAMVSDLASREMRMHLQRAYPLAVAATITPLLGLFGTVYGMVGAFEVIARSGEMGNAALMADSISYALMTTVLGLIIAIPSLALYHLFRMKTNLLSLALEEQYSDLIAQCSVQERGEHAH